MFMSPWIWIWIWIWNWNWKENGDTLLGCCGSSAAEISNNSVKDPDDLLRVVMIVDVVECWDDRTDEGW